MNINHHSVNVLPPDLPIARLEELAAEYRQRLLDDEPEGLPDWYIRAIIDVLEARLNDRPLAS